MIRTPSSTRAVGLATVAALALLAGCGGSDDAGEAAEVTTAPTPSTTAAPTTEPVATTTPATTAPPTTMAPAAPPTTALPTTAPPTTQPPATVPPTTAPDGPLGIDDAITSECIETTLVDDFGFTPDMAAGDTDINELTIDQQLEVATSVIGCVEPGFLGSEAVSSFADDLLVGDPTPIGRCLDEQFTGADGPALVVGFIALGQDTVVPEASRQPLIDTMTTCYTGELFAELITAEIAADPAMQDAIDTDCVRDAYSQPGATDSFWIALFDDPTADFENLPVEVQADFIAPLFGCISFGQVFADEAAVDGVILSPETVACVDGKVEESGLLEALLTDDEPDADELGAAFISCLSDDELQQVIEL